MEPICDIPSPSPSPSPGPPKTKTLIKLLIDSHSHIHDDDYQVDNFLGVGVQVERVCLCSATQKEWPLVNALANKHAQRVLPCFGIHPWNAQQVQPSDESWQLELRKYLESCPNAIVGEIGVDKIRKNTFQSGHQQQVFDVQVNIACQLNKPINVHCVQAHGWVI